jgi:hypothetical protein
MFWRGDWQQTQKARPGRRQKHDTPISRIGNAAKQGVSFVFPMAEIVKHFGGKKPNARAARCSQVFKLRNNG